MCRLLHKNYLTLNKIPCIVPAVDAAKSISPVDALMLNPVIELNVPPVNPVMFGVGSIPDTQYPADA
jgi:hypothetical protein